MTSLRSHEGGMLDLDDLICDVCDDREQLMAVFEEQWIGHAGDGMSSGDDHVFNDNNAFQEFVSDGARMDRMQEEEEMIQIANNVAEQANLALRSQVILLNELVILA